MKNNVGGFTLIPRIINYSNQGSVIDICVDRYIDQINIIEFRSKATGTQLINF